MCKILSMTQGLSKVFTPELPFTVRLYPSWEEVEGEDEKETSLARGKM